MDEKTPESDSTDKKKETTRPGIPVQRVPKSGTKSETPLEPNTESTRPVPTDPDFTPPEPVDADATVPFVPGADQTQPTELDAGATQPVEPAPSEEATQAVTPSAAEPDAEAPDVQPTQPLDTAALTRHPTGSPESTGGWYGSGIQANQQSQNAIDPDPTHPRQHVDETDPDATRVTPAAYNQSARANTQATRPRPPVPPPPSGIRVQRAGSAVPPPPPVRVVEPVPDSEDDNWKRPVGCLLRIGIGLLFLLVMAGLGVGSFMVYKYFTIASSLPSVEDLQSKAAKFETTRIVDRNGNSIYEIIDPNAGLRTFVPLEKISPYMIAATLATEDKDFYNHPGFDIIAIARAMWVNYTSGGIASGASTITQQLARGLLLGPDERYAQTVERKTREIVLAAEMTRRYTKEEIL